MELRHLRYFLERARIALAAAEDARATGANLEAGVIGTLRLGIAGEAPPRIASGMLAAFGATRPDVELTVVEAYGGTLMRDLRDGRLDAIRPQDLQGERIVVTGHRDGAGHDRSVSELLTSLGMTPVLERGGPGPALYAAVVAGAAVALSTRGAAAGRELFALPLEPARHLEFALLWRVETPALAELIRAGEPDPAPERLGRLAAVA
jgi:hypothetical protein